MLDIAPPQPVERLCREVEGLPPDRRLVVSGDQEVYFARADQIPSVLFEIGRLREVTFREAGEGSGHDTDLDGFDIYYHHLFLWNRVRHEVIGAYRMGLTDRIITDRGVEGLYTATLFEFDPRLFEEMGPAIEMGRSFIRLEYQRTYAGLLTLWKGIGAFVVRSPRYATLFGPVSISNEYESASQRVIVEYLRQNRMTHPWSRWVRPRNPFRQGWRRPRRSSGASLGSLDEVSTMIAQIESDQKGVPVLLKQYLKLGGTRLGFNVDPSFSNVLDVLTMVDLRRTDHRILKRTLGREGLEVFLDHHRNSTARVG